MEQFRCIPKDAYAVIFILHDDLYPKEAWNFVYGLADITGRTGVFSFARYNPEFFNEELPSDLAGLILYRACKVIIFNKEIGNVT